MITLQVTAPLGAPPPWRQHFDIDYHETAWPDLIARNPNEVLTAIWAIWRVCQADWLRQGYTTVMIYDRFRDAIVLQAPVASLPDIDNGIAWIGEAIRRYQTQEGGQRDV
jgi:hypothetical protein